MSQAAPTRQQAIPTLGGVRNSATRAVASLFGVFAGLIGLEHGYLTIHRQTDVQSEPLR